MIPYVMKDISEDDIVLFEKIKRVVEEIPDVDLGNKVLVSCHMITRALAKFFSIEYKDGLFHKGWQHSWLVTKNDCIIDPYPWVTTSGPIMVYIGAILSPWRSLYIEKEIPELKNKSFLLNVERVKRVTEETLKKLEFI